MSEDFAWFKEHYTEFQDKYGKSFIAIKNKTVLGVYDTYGKGVRETSKTEELGQYAIRFENGVTANISDFGKTFEDYDTLDAWLGGILLTSPMLDGSCVLYCTADNTGNPVFAHITGTNTVKDRGQVCAVSITVPLVDIGEEIGWETRYADMLFSETVCMENGMEAELVTTETSVTAYFIHGGVQYRINIAGNHEDAAAVLTDVIGTMK